MAAAESNMLPLGTKAPYFQLYDTISKDMVSLNDIKSDKATVVMFICNHCPYVHHVMKKLLKTAYEYMEKGVSFVAISSNDIENYPQDHPDLMKMIADMCQFPFPYLYDETQTVANEYKAACTPDFYIFNKDLKLVYRGRFDETRPQMGVKPTGKDLKKALDAILENREVDPKQFPSIGCSIKWKK